MAAVYAPRSLLTSSRTAESFLGVSVSKVFGEDEKVAALFDGSLGHVHEPSLVSFAPTAKPFGDIASTRYSKLSASGSQLDRRKREQNSHCDPYNGNYTSSSGSWRATCHAPRSSADQ